MKLTVVLRGSNRPWETRKAVHTRRIATFILGAWMAGCVFMAFVSIENLRAPTLVMTAPLPPVDPMIKQLGWERMSALLRHAASEQTRHVSRLWLEAQLLLGAVLELCLLLATQKRVGPLVLCGVMLVMALFQLRLAPELTYQGRETDFQPGSTTQSAMLRYLALQQIHFGVEIMKLLAGGALASYLFVFRTSRRSRKDVHAIDHADHSHIDG